MTSRKRPRRRHPLNLIGVDGFEMNPLLEPWQLPEKIVGFALDQRVFGPRNLMVAFATYDGRFLSLTYARRTDPIERCLEACLLHFHATRREGEEQVAAVVLCDERVEDDPVSPDFITRFEQAKELARTHHVHLVDWIACDDDRFRGARLRSLVPASDPDWWDVPLLPRAS